MKDFWVQSWHSVSCWDLHWGFTSCQWNLFVHFNSHILELGSVWGRSRTGFRTGLPAVVPVIILCASGCQKGFPAFPPAHSLWGWRLRQQRLCPALPVELCLPLALTDAAPLSAPAFSLVFPFLKMVLTEMPCHSEEEEERMAQILQIDQEDNKSKQLGEIRWVLSYLEILGFLRKKISCFALKNATALMWKFIHDMLRWVISKATRISRYQKQH